MQETGFSDSVLLVHAPPRATWFLWSSAPVVATDANQPLIVVIGFFRIDRWCLALRLHSLLTQFQPNYPNRLWLPMACTHNLQATLLEGVVEVTVKGSFKGSIRLSTHHTTHWKLARGPAPPTTELQQPPALTTTDLQQPPALNHQPSQPLTSSNHQPSTTSPHNHWAPATTSPHSPLYTRVLLNVPVTHEVASQKSSLSWGN